MYIFHLKIQHEKNGEKSQELEIISEIEMKRYVTSIKADMQLQN